MDAVLTTPAPEGVRLSTVASRAFGWSLLNTAVSRLGTLAIGIALARILGPEAFGTFAVAMVAMVAVLSFNELGVSLAIVRWKSDPHEIAPTVTTISATTSVMLFGGLYAAAPALSSALGDPDATGVVRLMAASIIISGLVATPAALLQRDFRQRRRMMIDQVNTWLGAFLSLTLALAGSGAMSLAIGRVGGAAAAAILFVVFSGYPFRFGFDPTKARALLRFGLPLAGASMVVFAVAYAEQLATGALLGATALGYYVLAFNLASWPVHMFSQPLRAVAPAVFARMQHDSEQMNAAFRAILRLLAAVTLPVCLLLAGAAESVIRVVYGDAWAPAAPILAVLALVAAVRILIELAYDYLVIRGRGRAVLIVQVVWLAFLVPALLAGGKSFGMVGIAAGQLVVTVVVVVPMYLVLLNKCGLHAGRLFRCLVLPLVAAGLVGTGAWATGIVVNSSLLACFGAGALALGALGALAFRERRVLREHLGPRPDTLGAEAIT